MATSTSAARSSAKTDVLQRRTRFEARVPVRIKRQWEHAAALTGASVSDFVIRSAQTEAARTIREHEVLVLNERASRAFFKLMMNPPAPNARLKAAMRRYKASVTEK